MNERAASTYTMQPQLAADSAVRPKVMRRPAQFAAKASTAQALPTLLTTADAASNAKPAAPSRAWQDDGRFAITLLAIVILINVAVSAWLSALSPMPTAAPVTAIPLIAPTPSTPASASVHILDDAAAASSDQ